jgi:hypothetical protein
MKMPSDTTTIEQLYGYAETDPNLNDPDVAHVAINKDKVLGMHKLPGLNMETRQIKDGIEIHMSLNSNTTIKKPVHLCFGMLPEKGIQRIVMNIDIKENAHISLFAHCIFPTAVDVKHIMDAQITIGDHSSYSYLEKHVHSPFGGVKVYPKANVSVGKHASFETEFELLKGLVGVIDIDYEATVNDNGRLRMTSRVNGKKEDEIRIKETAHLNGEKAKGVLVSKVAVRDKANAEIHNELSANSAYAQGHVDCKEIVQDNGKASAIPIVKVEHPKAHITHEAAIGSVDHKQLETLMSRGMDEDSAIEKIINGLLENK